MPALSQTSPAALTKGALVRTRRVWPGGIHKAAVERVFERDGEMWAGGPNWAFPASDLVVIRAAL